jgi:hypothetical protein
MVHNSATAPMNITLDLATIGQVDLSRFLPYVAPEYKEFFPGEPGREHYKLLGHLSSLFNEVTIFDVGTDAGCSAMALSHNPNNHVISYDIVNRRRSDIHLPNVEFRIGNVLEHGAELVTAPLISLDTAHEGPFEHEFYRFLASSPFRGLLILDDIYLNEPMKAFWDSITHQKFDVTNFGHWSGTGLVVF